MPSYSPHVLRLYEQLWFWHVLPPWSFQLVTDGLFHLALLSLLHRFIVQLSARAGEVKTLGATGAGAAKHGGLAVADQGSALLSFWAASRCSSGDIVYDLSLLRVASHFVCLFYNHTIEQRPPGKCSVCLLAKIPCF
jgi:hypothetical protein